MNNKLIKEFTDIFFNTFYIGSRGNNTQHFISDLSIQESYSVQDQVTKKKIARGEHVIGYKVGCTSSAIQSQFGLSEPIFGRLFWPHIFNEGAKLNWKRYTNCAIEPEMVLKICKDLKGENLPDKVIKKAIEYVSPGIEIHNFKFWYMPPSLQELICSNGLHAGLIIGNNKISPDSLSFKLEWFIVYIDDKIITKAVASEIMRGPLNSLRWLVGRLTKQDEVLKAGSIVIPGSPVELVNIRKNLKLKILIEKVGKATAYFKS
jgi:2-keto-4-pentenoate hydratase